MAFSALFADIEEKSVLRQSSTSGADSHPSERRLAERLFKNRNLFHKKCIKLGGPWPTHELFSISLSNTAVDKVVKGADFALLLWNMHWIAIECRKYRYYCCESCKMNTESQLFSPLLGTHRTHDSKTNDLYVFLLSIVCNISNISDE